MIFMFNHYHFPNIPPILNSKLIFHAIMAFLVQKSFISIGKYDNFNPLQSFDGKSYGLLFGLKIKEKIMTNIVTYIHTYLCIQEM